jgi:hypothetical protein
MTKHVNCTDIEHDSIPGARQQFMSAILTLREVPKHGLRAGAEA